MWAEKDLLPISSYSCSGTWSLVCHIYNRQENEDSEGDRVSLRWPVICKPVQLSWTLERRILKHKTLFPDFTFIFFWFERKLREFFLPRALLVESRCPRVAKGGKDVHALGKNGLQWGNCHPGMALLIFYCQILLLGCAGLRSTCCPVADMILVQYFCYPICLCHLDMAVSLPGNASDFINVTSES